MNSQTKTTRSIRSSKNRDFILSKSVNPVNDEGVAQCFYMVTSSMYISLAPCYTQHPINGIKSQHLDPMIMTYFSKAKGVVLSYSNIKISGRNKSIDSEGNPLTIARIEGSSPFTFFWISVDFLIWRPQVGDCLEGYVYMQTASHIGLLIHDTFNATIKKYNIPNTWRFLPSQQDEYSEDSTSNFKSFGHWVTENDLRIEGKLKFNVKALHTTGRVISVEGTLISPGFELESQPIFRERRTSSTSQAVNSHMKFNEEDNSMPMVPVIEETLGRDLPIYSKDNEDGVLGEDDAIVNASDTNDDDSD
ncbi:uncharacterized protein PRCAT00003617001 [Priceomyces carsonii]|uniref:uncharacterized protein n=1 Tax=Priceomyces carsonii TaxID=28549 RepID=UPI002EDA08D6|nr:unnamed protein product [Priceomyces carsonii]